MRIVLTGASGRLGGHLRQALVRRGHEVIGWCGPARTGTAFRPIDVTAAAATLKALEETAPDAIVHAAALSSADEAARGPARARAVNIDATRSIAAWAARCDRRLLFTSTDLVFDGERSWYREDDPAEPRQEYGRTKLAAERFVLEAPRGTVARLSLLYGRASGDAPGFFDHALAALRAGERRYFFSDEYRTPIDYETAAEVLAVLLESDARGTIHVGGRERLSRFELMRRAAAAHGLDPELVQPNLRSDADACSPRSEPRPADVSLDTSRLSALFPQLSRPPVASRPWAVD